VGRTLVDPDRLESWTFALIRLEKNGLKGCEKSRQGKGAIDEFEQEVGRQSLGSGGMWRFPRALRKECDQRSSWYRREYSPSLSPAVCHSVLVYERKPARGARGGQLESGVDQAGDLEGGQGLGEAFEPMGLGGIGQAEAVLAQ
jgi:hypothetical protein